MTQLSTKLKVAIHEAFLPVLRFILPVVRWLDKKTYYHEALRLNRELFSHVSNIPVEEIDFVKNKIREIANAGKYDATYRETWVSHGPRLALSKRWIQEALQDRSGNLTGLDLGTRSIATELWSLWFPQVQWRNTDFDLRASWDVPTSSVDVVVCTELVEHLPDVLDGKTFNETFVASGLKGLLGEAWKALKPGGFLFITTPNASSVLHVKAVLEKRPPWFFDRHIREYTLDELLPFIQQAEFHVQRAEAVHCMTVFGITDFVAQFEFLVANGYPTDGRGDDLFILARKPT
ncbi:MAG TPA: methyltransferase domain-containing protein [Anaerolineales bacterium]|nr:methyltransferase domain-containing protein [Anaerolineales bacterium]